MCAKLTHKFFVGNDEFPGGAFLLLWLHSDSMAMALPTCSNAYEKNKVVDRWKNQGAPGNEYFEDSWTGWVYSLGEDEGVTGIRIMDCFANSDSENGLRSTKAAQEKSAGCREWISKQGDCSGEKTCFQTSLHDPEIPEEKRMTHTYIYIYIQRTQWGQRWCVHLSRNQFIGNPYRLPAPLPHFPAQVYPGGEQWESKGEGRGGRRFMNSVAQTRQEKTREGTVKKCNTFHGYCWAGSSPVHTHTHTPSCGGGFGCLCTRTFFQWWPMGHMKPSSNDRLPCAGSP